MEIRQLQVEDIFTVARMLGKITKGARLQLASALVSDYSKVANEVVGTGDGKEKEFALVYKPVQGNSESISVDKAIQVRLKQYTINYATGGLLFTTAPKDAQVISASYVAKKANPAELGMVLFQSLVTDAEEDLKAWLASLAGKELAEFRTMPATAVLDVIEGLFEQEGIKDFFAKASLLANNLLGKG